MTCECPDCDVDPCHHDCPLDELCLGCRSSMEEERDRIYACDQASGK